MILSFQVRTIPTPKILLASSSIFFDGDVLLDELKLLFRKYNS